MFRRGSPAGGVSVVVEGVNIAKRHTKPRQSAGRPTGMPKIQQGGILDIAQPMPIGKVMLVCSHCGKPTRIGHGRSTTAAASASAATAASSWR